MKKKSPGICAEVLLVAVAGLVSMAGSASPGGETRHIMPAGPVTLVSSWAYVPRLRFQMPCDYEIESMATKVYLVHNVTCFGRHGAVVGGIAASFGHYSDPSDEVTKPGVIKLPGQVGSREVTWYEWTDRTDRGVVAQRWSVVKGFFDSAPGHEAYDLENLVVRIKIWAATDAEADTLQRSVSGLEMVK